MYGSPILEKQTKLIAYLTEEPQTIWCSVTDLETLISQRLGKYKFIKTNNTYIKCNMNSEAYELFE